jgi:hypothetical protein
VALETSNGESVSSPFLAPPTRPPLCGQSLSGAKPTSLLYRLLDHELERQAVFDLNRLQRSVADPR